MTTTFTWIPDWAPSGDHTINVLTVAYGDGYVQDIGNGINCDMPPWTVSFSNRLDAEFDAIKAFLVALAPGERFNWTPPKGSAGLYKCTRWTETPYVNGINAHAISAVFQQVVA